MPREPGFRTDLYRGTAPYYARYRPPYPPALLDDLRARVPVSGQGRLLDLACGTGQIALPLAHAFATVTAVDQEAESVEYGRAVATDRRITNVTWICAPAESVALSGLFELVAVGNAFQRMNRQAVAQRILTWLQPGGAVALLWGPIPWAGPQRWQTDLAELVVEWLERMGASDRIPPGWQAAMEDDPHAAVLQRAGFVLDGRYEFTIEQTWTVDTLVGFMYSTSILNLGVLGADRAAFEQALAERIGGGGASGTVTTNAVYAYDLARRPTSGR